MPHLHDKPGQHDFTTSAFIVLSADSQPDNKPKLLMHWHGKLQRWLQYGGHIELHETPWQALRHELLEESGYELDQLQLLQPKERLLDLGDSVIHPQPFSVCTHRFGDLDHYHIDLTYAFITSESPRHPVAEHEKTEQKLFDREALAALKTGETPENVRRGGLYIFDTLLNAWQPVDHSEYK